MANNPTHMKPTNPYEPKPLNPPMEPFPLPTDKGGPSLGEKKANEMAADVATKASEIASSAAQGVSKAATAIGEKAEQSVAGVGCGMQSLAGSIREHAPLTGVMHTASVKVADTLESSGRYLKEEGLHGMAEDLTSLIRRNPIPAVLIGVGIGFLIARSTTRS
jgi:hypothetical protein